LTTEHLKNWRGNPFTTEHLKNWCEKKTNMKINKDKVKERTSLLATERTGKIWRTSGVDNTDKMSEREE
jgi:hypothetical protein